MHRTICIIVATITTRIMRGDEGSRMLCLETMIEFFWLALFDDDGGDTNNGGS